MFVLDFGFVLSKNKIENNLLIGKVAFNKTICLNIINNEENYTQK